MVARKDRHTVVLKMSRAEAQTIRDVCANIGGVSDTRRRHIHAVSDRLDNLGFTFDLDLVDDLHGSITFCSVPGTR